MRCDVSSIARRERRGRNGERDRFDLFVSVLNLSNF